MFVHPKKLYGNVHSVITQNSQELETPGWAPADEWINTTWCVHTMGYYSVIKRDDGLTHAVTRMTHENITLKWKKPRTKTTQYAPLVCNDQKRQVHGKRKQLCGRWATGGCRGGGGGSEGCQLRGAVGFLGNGMKTFYN